MIGITAALIIGGATLLAAGISGGAAIKVSKTNKEAAAAQKAIDERIAVEGMKNAEALAADTNATAVAVKTMELKAQEAQWEINETLQKEQLALQREQMMMQEKQEAAALALATKELEAELKIDSGYLALDQSEVAHEQEMEKNEAEQADNWLAYEQQYYDNAYFYG